MTVCKVFLYGLKPCDLTSSTNDETLNVDIKPLTTPVSSRSSVSSDILHEITPIRIMIHETTQGRHRICVSQTLLRTHTDDV